MYKTLSKKELIFLFAMFFEILAMLISLTTIPHMVGTTACNLLLKLFRYIGYLLVAIKILLDDYGRKEIICIVSIMVVLVMNSLTVGGNTILCLFLFVIGMKGLDFKKLSRYMVIWLLAGVLITVIGSQIGLIDNWRYTIAGRPRVTLGYFYPSHATSAIFYCMILLCYVMGNKIKFWHVCVMELINIWQYTQTDSRAGTLLMLIVPVAFWIFKFLKKHTKDNWMCRIMVLAFPAASIFSVVASVVYNGSGILYKVNAIISNRLKLAHNAINEFGLSLFGDEIKWIGNGGYGYTFTEFKGEYNYVDCSYIKIMLESGIVFFVIVVLGYTLASFYAMRNNDKYLLLSLAFVAVYSIIEPRLIEIGFNPFILTLAVLVDYSLKSKREENHEFA